MRRLVKLFLLPVLIILLLTTGCFFFEQSGSVDLKLTDSPIDADNVSGVYVSISEIQYHLGTGEEEGEWVKVSDFEGGTYNLLELTAGVTTPLAEFSMPSGRVTQIRFILDAPEEGVTGAPENPGCYILFEDETSSALFVPSGSQSGVKLTGEFEVPVNGSVDITADFDVRKSVSWSGSRYILRPTIKLIVDNQAGSISGDVSGLEAGYKYIVFAYEAETWLSSEINEDANGIRFSNAVSSFALEDADSDGVADPVDPESTDGPGYKMAFLAQGDYTLVVARYENLGLDTETVSANIAEDPVSVESQGNTNQALDLTGLVF